MDHKYNGSSDIIKEMTELLKSKQISASAALKMMLKLELHSFEVRREMMDGIAENKKAIETIKLDYQREVDLLKRVGIGYNIYNNPRRAFIIILSLYSLSESGLIAKLFSWALEHLKLQF